MNDKPDEVKDNSNKKNIIFEDSNTANSSLHEETQNNSQLSNTEFNDNYTKLLNSISKLMQDNAQLNEKYTRINEDNAQMKEKYNQMEEKYTKINEDNAQLKENYIKINEDNAQLKEKYNQMEEKYTKINEDNSQLTTKMQIVEQRLDGLESLIMRNNINIDLLANRDSLKTILLIFSYNLGVTKKEEMIKINNNQFYKHKFTQILLKVFNKLNKSLNPPVFFRQGFSNTQPANEKDKDTIKKQFIFAECIHFIVCTIDNIIHPQEKEENNNYSKLIGSRSKEKLEKCLIQFFDNPKTTDDLKVMFRKIKDNEKVDKVKNINEVNNDVLQKKEVDKSVQEKGMDTEKKKEDEKNKAKMINDKKEDISIEENKNINDEKDKKRKEKNGNQKVEDKEVFKSENNEDKQEKEDKLISNEIKDEHYNGINVVSKLENEGNINEIKNEEKEGEKLINFENYDEPKNIAYLKNKEYYEKLNGKNNYENEFFIQYLFSPDLSSFSETEMKINYEEFNNYINNELDKFISFNTGINPFDLLKKLKWLS